MGRGHVYLYVCTYTRSNSSSSSLCLAGDSPFVHTLPGHDPAFRVLSECHGERTFDSKVFLATSCGFISDSAI